MQNNSRVVPLQAHAFQPQASTNTIVDQSFQKGDQSLLIPKINLTRRRKSIDIKLPNQADLNDYLDEHHPRSERSMPFTVSEVGKFKTGWHYCLTSTTQSDSDRYGAGLTLYFRFLKQMIFYFFIFSLLSFPQIFLSYQADIQSQGKGKLTISDLLMATTAGSLGSTGNSCSKIDLISLYNQTHSTNITQQLYCATGTIGLSYLTMGLIYQDKYSQGTCVYDDPSSVLLSCNRNDSNFQQYFNETCVGQQTCNFEFDTTFFTDDCPYTTEQKLQSYTTDQQYSAYIQVFCKDSYIQTFSKRTETKSTAIICALFDLAIVLIFLFCIITLNVQENTATVNVKQSQVFISNYSLEFHNIPTTRNSRDLQIQMKDFIENGIKRKFGLQVFISIYNLKHINVVDIQLSQSNRFITLHKQRGEALMRRNNFINRFEMKFRIHILEESDLKLYKTHMKLQSYSDQFFSPKNKVFAKELINEIGSMEIKLETLEMQINVEKDQKDEECKSAFVTFETIDQRNHAQYLYGPDQIRKSLYYVCGECCVDSSILVLNGELLESRPAQDPENINWENLHVSRFQSFLRQSLSFVVTIFLITITIIAIVLLKQQQTHFEQQNPSVNCVSQGDVTLTQAYVDIKLGTSKIGLLECYCQQNLITNLDTYFPDGQQHCQTWFQGKVESVSLSLAVVLIIIVINEIMKFIFIKLSFQEKHKSMSMELSSRMFKVFFVQFINTALIIIILNTQFHDTILDSNSYIAQYLDGRFKDTSVLWFKQVGSTVLLTMFLQLFIPIVLLIIQITYIKLQICWDKCFLQPMEFTSESTQSDLNNLYRGPAFNIEIRYAQVLNVICVCLFYSSGLPVLYMTTFFFLFFSYWVDKYLFLRVCRKPQKIDKNIADLVRRIIRFFIIFHLIWSIWIYGNPQLFQQSGYGQNYHINQSTQSGLDRTLNTYSINSQLIDRFFQRALSNQCIASFGVFLLLILVYLVWPRLIAPIIRTIFFFCFTGDSKYLQRLITKGISVNDSIYTLIPLSKVKKQMKLLSYRMRNEKQPSFLEYLRCQLNRLRHYLKFVVEKSDIHLSGLSSYDILMNEEYEKHMPDVFASAEGDIEPFEEV